jgi:uncharacterized membrane protein SirB2
MISLECLESSNILFGGEWIMNGTIIYLLYFLAFFIVYLLIGFIIMKLKKKDEKKDKWLKAWEVIGWIFNIFV